MKVLAKVSYYFLFPLLVFIIPAFSLSLSAALPPNGSTNTEFPWWQQKYLDRLQTESIQIYSQLLERSNLSAEERAQAISQLVTNQSVAKTVEEGKTRFQAIKFYLETGKWFFPDHRKQFNLPPNSNTTVMEDLESSINTLKNRYKDTEHPADIFYDNILSLLETKVNVLFQMGSISEESKNSSLKFLSRIRANKEEAIIHPITLDHLILSYYALEDETADPTYASDDPTDPTYKDKRWAMWINRALVDTEFYFQARAIPDSWDYKFRYLNPEQYFFTLYSSGRDYSIQIGIHKRIILALNRLHPDVNIDGAEEALSVVTAYKKEFGANPRLEILK